MYLLMQCLDVASYRGVVDVLADVVFCRGVISRFHVFGLFRREVPVIPSVLWSHF